MLKFYNTNSVKRKKKKLLTMLEDMQCINYTLNVSITEQNL